MASAARAVERLASLFDREPAITAAAPRAVLASSRTVTPDIRSIVAAEIRRRPEAKLRALWYIENVNAVISAERWVRNVLSEVRYRAAHLTPDGTTQACDDDMVRSIASTLQTGDWGRLASLVAFVGSAYVEGRWKGAGSMEWKVRSDSEYRWQGDDKQWPMVVTSRADPTGVPMVRPGEQAPLWFQVFYSSLALADEPFSPLMGSQALEACEALLLVTTVETALARSRLSNGILFIPSELSFTEVVSPGEAQAIINRTPSAALQDYMLTPIKDPTSPEAVVPIVLRGPAEYGQALRHLIAEHTADPEDFEARRTALLKELAMVLPIPESALLGLGDMNHWNGAIQEDNSHRVYWRPAARLCANAFTDQFLRPMLTRLGDLGLWSGNPLHYCIEPDMSQVTKRPGDWQRDVALYNAKLIGGKAARASNGFSEDDAPTPEELAAMEKGAAPPSAPPGIRPTGSEPVQLGKPDFEVPKFSPGFDGELPAPAPVPSTPERPKDMPTRPAQNPVVGTKKAAVGWSSADLDALLGRARRASAFDELVGDEVAVEDETTYWPPQEVMDRIERRLSAIDGRTAGALQAIGDDGLRRAYKALGKRTFKLASRDPWRAAARAASTGEHDHPELVLTVPGITKAVSVNEQEVLAGEIEQASGRIETALEEADAEIDAVLVEELGGDRAEYLSDDRTRHRLEAVAGFRAAMLAFAASTVARAASKAVDAHHDLVAPRTPKGIIAAVMAIAGGASRNAAGTFPMAVPDAGRPLAGHALGAVVAAVIERATGARIRRYVWHHDHPRDPFPPHVDLDGAVFASLDDPVLGGYFPGDHHGCLCSVRVQWSPGRRPRRDG